jgi:cyclophilin family peptidyl-prolyl cis-trans isomerase
MLKKLTCLCLLGLAVLSAQPAATQATAAGQESAKLVPWLEIRVTDFGRILVELFPDVAPLNVRNVETLAAQGFYDGLTFHRIVPGFVIQGGDPAGNGTGGPDYTVPAEIKLNHVRGGFAMARTDNPAKASSSCQFYINLNDLPMLDGNYTVIGQVRDGMAVVDSIARVKCDPVDMPLEPVRIGKVTVQRRPASAATAPLGQTEVVVAKETPKEIKKVTKHEMTIEIKDLGKIAIELFPRDAPRNVANVESLAQKGFYDGLTFHRVIPGFVIQGGDPKGDGSGGPDYTVPAELKRKHVRGAVAMARLGDQANPTKASSSCQFYICLKDLDFLDKAGYTVIGQVKHGMDVVDKIAATPTGPNDKPISPVIMNRVTVE